MHRHSSNGLEQWAARYNGLLQGSEQLTALALSHDGARIFVTGASPTPTTDNDYATVAFNAATGSQLWAAIYDGTGHGFDAGEALVLSPDDATVYVTGASDGGTPSSGRGFAPEGFVDNFDCVTIAYDAATGAQKWITRFDAAAGNDYATSMMLSSDGNSLYVTGGSTTDHFLDYLTIAYRFGSPPPLEMTSPRRADDGFVLTGRGVPLSSINIEASPDLVTSFGFLATVTADATGAFEYTDTDASTFEQRFYRAVYP